jgi:hypothetical protein
VTREGREGALPERAVSIDELPGALERLTRQVAMVIPALALATQQASAFQDPEMLRDRGEGHRERFGQFTDRRWPRGKPREKSSPRAIRQRREDRVQVVVFGRRDSSS